MVEKNYRLKTFLINFNVKRLISGILLVSAFWLYAFEAFALNIISDDESEIFLQKIIQPLFKAAGVRYDSNNIYIVNDPSLNAFVGDGNNLFIHTGTIINAGSADELSGVIAHETGHIQGGHIMRMKLKAQGLSEATLASTIAAGAAALLTGRSDVAVAIALGSQSSAITNMTIYQTGEERSADEAAVNLLNKTGQSPAGILAFMKRISRQNTLNGIEETPYFRTHPVTRERISFLENAVRNSPYQRNNKSGGEFSRVQAKLFAYLEAPKNTFRKYPLGNKSVPARYAQAIAYFKMLQFKQALQLIDGLIKEEPKNPFFREVKAQIYLETGEIKAAKAEYKEAVKLLPASALLQASYAQTILEDNPSAQEIQEAINILHKSLIRKPSGFAWLLLSRAYGLKGDDAYAAYAAAEYSIRIGAFDTAKQQANQALRKSGANKQLKIKTQDLLSRLSELEK